MNELRLHDARRHDSGTICPGRNPFQINALRLPKGSISSLLEPTAVCEGAALAQNTDHWLLPKQGP